MQDFFIIFGMFVAIITGIVGVVVSKILFVRIGFLLAVVSTCVGLAYFGWLPLFGGSHQPDTYFGCEMIFMGLISFMLFAAIEQVSRHLKKAV